MALRKHFVFLESNTTGTGERLIYKAIAKGLYPVFITSDPEKYSFFPLEKVELIVLDSLNKEIIFNYLSNIENIIGIYSSSEFYIETVAWLASKLDLPTTNSKSIKLCRCKYSLYQALLPSVIHVPSTKKIVTFNEAESTLDEFSFPVVVKPNNGSGSIGVKLCETKKKCLEHVRFLFKDAYSEVLIQEYIDGSEFSVEVCSLPSVNYILGITRKYLGDPPFFIEIGHDFPALLSVDQEKEIQEFITILLSVLGYNFGFSHVEIKIRNGIIYIIEVNPRLAGGLIPVLIENATGIDVLSSLIDLYTNHKIDIQPKYNKYSAIRHLILNDACNINHIIYKSLIDVDEMKIIKNERGVFVPMGDFRDRVAYIIVSDKSAEHCKVKADLALSNFDISFEKIE